MVRFDIAVANRNRTEVFWQGWNNFRNFDSSQDRIVFFDASDEPLKELAICKHYMRRYGIEGCNFLFMRRQAGSYSLGMIMDYVRMTGEGVLDAPQHVFFMQDHYINNKVLVDGDTLPDGGVVDFNEMQHLFEGNNKLVVSSCRWGIRICASVPEEMTGKDFVTYDGKTGVPWLFMPGELGSIYGDKYCVDHFIYYNGRHHIKGSNDQCLAFDGSNFCVDPRWLIGHYETNKSLYLGVGDYGDALLWETRIGKILCDQKLSFYELHRKLLVSKPEELKQLQPDPDPDKLWSYLYNSPLFYSVLGGDDIWPYPFKQTDAYFRYQKYIEQWHKKRNRDTVIRLWYDSRPDAQNFKGIYRKDVPLLFSDERLTQAEIEEVSNKSSLITLLLIDRAVRRALLTLKKRTEFIRALPKIVINKILRTITLSKKVELL